MTVPPAPLNVLVILTDEQSADEIGALRNDGLLHTPAMDSLVARGTRFSHAYCAHPLCVPSRASLITGRYPHELGIMSLAACNKHDHAHPNHPVDVTRYPTFGSHFRNAGYDTAYFGKWHIPIHPQDPAASGFDHVDQRPHALEQSSGNGLDRVSSDQAIAFLQQPRERPFLMVLSYNNPHNICEWFRGTRGSDLPDGDVGQPPAAEACPPMPANHDLPVDEVDAVTALSKKRPPRTEEDWRQLRWAYHRMTELTDRRLSRVLATLSAVGKLDDTVIVLTSDHGELAGAHGFNQKRLFYEESAGVPFVVCHPHRRQPAVSDVLVNMGIDLFPTLCDAAGIAPPSGLPGQALVTGAQQARPWVVVATELKREGTLGRMLRSERYKYCLYEEGQHRESLVDLAADPGEMFNLARQPGHRDILLQHRASLRAYAEKTGDTWVLDHLPVEDARA